MSQVTSPINSADTPLKGTELLRGKRSRDRINVCVQVHLWEHKCSSHSKKFDIKRRVRRKNLELSAARNTGPFIPSLGVLVVVGHIGTKDIQDLLT